MTLTSNPSSVVEQMNVRDQINEIDDFTALVASQLCGELSDNARIEVDLSEKTRFEVHRLAENFLKKNADSTKPDHCYAIAAWLDELWQRYLSDSKWNYLEVQFFRTSVRSDQFWSAAQQLSFSGVPPHVAYAYWLCVVLGFQGNFDKVPVEKRRFPSVTRWLETLQPGALEPPVQKEEVLRIQPSHGALWAGRTGMLFLTLSVLLVPVIVILAIQSCAV